MDHEEAIRTVGINDSREVVGNSCCKETARFEGLPDKLPHEGVHFGLRKTWDRERHGDR